MYASMTSWLDHLSSGNQKRLWRDPVKRVAKIVERSTRNLYPPMEIFRRI
jgi:hypothetical protein